MTTIQCGGFLLDMDGVLVDSTAAVARVWSRWAATHGLDPVETTRRAHGRPSMSTLRELLPQASQNVLERENEWMETEEIADLIDVIALPGALEMLSTLAVEQFAVVTSATRPLAEVRLGAGGLLKYARNMISSADIQHGKPHPEPYLKGAELLHLRGEDCVVIEDAPSGVRSGKAAAARVIALRTTAHDDELFAAGADWVVNDCSAIRLVSFARGRKIEFKLLDSPHERRIPKMS